MRTWMRSKITLLFMTCALLVAIPAIAAIADEVANNLDNSVDATVENMNLTAGGANGSAKFYVVGTTQGDTINGCNFKDGGDLLLNVQSSNNSVATVSPSQVTISECGENNGAAISVTPVSQGSSTITVTKRQQSTVGGSFTLNTATFQVNVAAGAKQNQTISFDSGTPTSKTFGDANFNVSATATSGLPVSYSAKAGSSCTVSSAGLVSLTGAGTCTVVASQGGNGSYNAASNVEHAISVGKATPTISWSNPSAITYGTALGSTQLNATAQGVGGGSLAGGFAYDPASGAVLGAGTHNLSTIFTPTNTTDYTTASKSVPLTVNPKAATVTADDQTKTYGQADPSFTSQTTGLVGNDTLTGVSCGVSGAHANAGSYDITCSGNTNTNYNVNYVKGTLTVEKATLNVNADSKTITYGDADPTPTWSYSGFVNGDTSAAGLTGSASCSIDSSAGPDAGTYTNAITCAPGNLSSTNYNFVTGSKGTLTIEQATPVVNINWSNSTYNGSANAASASVTGVGGADLGSADSLTYYSGNAASGTPLSGAPTNAGTYTVKAVFNATTNYKSNFAIKTITIAKADQTIDFAALDNKVYGDAPFTVSASADSGLPVSFTASGNCSVSGNTVTINAAGSCTITAKQGGNVNYNAATDVSRSFQIASWTLKGFHQPVDMGIVNNAKAGSTVPLKFNVFRGATELTNVSDVKQTFTQKVACASGVGDDIELYSTGSTSLRYSGTPGVDGQFIFNWQTPKAAGSCYKVTLVTNDGSQISADFRLK